MKVIAINGSPRKDGNTHIALTMMREELEQQDIEVEIIQIGHQLIHGCIACSHCRQSTEHKCVFKDDPVNEVAAKMRQADGIILGSPTYYGGIAGTMKSFLDRAFFSGGSGKYFRNKAATAVVTVRRSGGVEVYNQLMNYLTLAEAVIPPSQYWVAIHGMNPGEVMQDAEGQQIIRRNANAMAWLMKTLETGGETLPRIEAGVTTSFIR